MSEASASPEERSAAGPRPRRKLGRLGLIIWLVTPIALVAAMWFLIDRSQGVPRGGRKMGSPQTAPTAADAKPNTAPSP